MVKLDIFRSLGMIVADDRAVAVAAIAAVECNPHGTLHVHLLSGEKLMFQESAAVDFVDQVTEGVRNAQRLSMTQVAPLIHRT